MCVQKHHMSLEICPTEGQRDSTEVTYASPTCAAVAQQRHQEAGKNVTVTQAEGIVHLCVGVALQRNQGRQDRGSEEAEEGRDGQAGADRPCQSRARCPGRHPQSLYCPPVLLVPGEPFLDRRCARLFLKSTPWPSRMNSLCCTSVTHH